MSLSAGKGVVAQAFGIYWVPTIICEIQSQTGISYHTYRRTSMRHSFTVLAGTASLVPSLTSIQLSVDGILSTY
ncbi:hypothetical protein vseg_021735 [Gypsophila vaccaria]